MRALAGEMTCKQKIYIVRDAACPLDLRDEVDAILYRIRKRPGGRRFDLRTMFSSNELLAYPHAPARAALACGATGRASTARAKYERYE